MEFLIFLLISEGLKLELMLLHDEILAQELRLQNARQEQDFKYSNKKDQ